MIAWVLTGFGPTFGGLEIDNRKLRHASMIALKTDIKGGGSQIGI